MDTKPKNLDEAIDVLKSINTPYMSINDRYIRNDWGLWNGSDLAYWFYARDIFHADDMSAIIIESFRRTNNGEPLELDKQIEKYHKHWEKQMGPDHLKVMKKQVCVDVSKMRDFKINDIIENRNARIFPDWNQ